MANDITVKHGWILPLFVSLYITKRSEAVLQWGKRKNIKKSAAAGGNMPFFKFAYLIFHNEAV